MLESLGVPEALSTPLTVVVGVHALALAVWAFFFVKDLIAPPMHPIQKSQLEAASKKER